ncbi:MAG TPA: type 1 glutamine amidotransferase [Gaiellaceae bacterium]|jgi:GMP synthase-like glutamine amidotransferase
MDVLAIVHGSNARAGVFGQAVVELGHSLDEWSLAWETPIPKPLDAYGAVMVFGGAMHADQEGHHPWLREENFFLQRLLDLGVPTLGICLGVQLLAKAAHATVGPLSEPEIGWFEVELTDEGADDPVLGRLPRRFEAFEWHYYTYGLPACSEELARSATCTQAFRLGERVWGVQFHPEVTFAQVESWIADPEDPPPDAERLRAETVPRIAAWNELGRELCSAFVEAAERAATTSV